MSGHSASTKDFEKLDIRVGRVIDLQPFPEGRYSTHILMIDFGPELGTKKSLAKLVPNYTGPEIVGRQVLAVMNFPPRQIGKHLSEVLTLGVSDENGNVILFRPDRDVPLGPHCRSRWRVSQQGFARAHRGPPEARHVGS